MPDVLRAMALLARGVSAKGEVKIEEAARAVCVVKRAPFYSSADETQEK